LFFVIRGIGDSQGILIPKLLLQRVGLLDQVEVRVEGHALVLRRPKNKPRQDWAEASQLPPPVTTILCCPSLLTTAMRN
jgi:antitoxin component of MazEF toxin-antitoxin module